MVADRVGQVGQHQPAEHGVHRLVGDVRRHVRLDQLDVGHAAVGELGGGVRQPVGGAVDGQHRPLRADRLGDQQRDLTGAGAEVDDPHAGTDPGQLQRQPGGRLQHLRLPVQPGQLLGAVAEHVSL